MADLSYSQISEILKPDFSEGKLYWRARGPHLFRDGNYSAQRSCNIWNNRFAGKEAFTNDNGDGYRCGKIFDRSYRAHRVLWLLHTGEWPTDQIDHINGDRADNRIINLRAVSNTDNARNSCRPSNNTSGVVGVYWYKRHNMWYASIRINEKNLSLGYFEDFADAVATRKAAEVNYGFHENHGKIV